MATSIYCPKCEWQPGPHDRWMCIPGCNTVWNTFETHALCPGCHKQWHVTQCLLCAARSPHDDWYHDHDEDSESAGEPAEQEEELELVEVG
ncbi:MAG TPA: hypothetical protein VJO33_02650 [Gemmatimonadaceae bacterium]|nr:hypothetical protein [Gemmatimonadaceae bacterium]